MTGRERRSVRIANCSGFFGDRLSAARELVDGGGIDVLTGDWLAELTMHILQRKRLKDSDAGYAGTFLTQLEDVLSTCLETGTRIVANAGGVNPAACARAVRQLAERQGLTVSVAAVTGDDVTEEVRRRIAEGWDPVNTWTGEPLSALGAPVEVANAYVGGWAVAEALAAGADVVVTGRVTDASPLLGSAAWWFGWKRTDWDALAGAVVAAHVIECGPQATGGNYSWFTEIADLVDAGFPIAEVAEDGSAVITKQQGTGGAVTVDTVTAQLLYEIDGPRYLNPDVCARLDTVRLSQDGPDRVRVSGVRGEPAPDTVKVGLVCPLGYRNSMTLGLTGLRIEDKAQVAEQLVWTRVPGGSAAFDEVSVRLLRADRADPASALEATALLTLSVRAGDRQTADRLGRAVIETGLASYPGFYALGPPVPSTPISVFWPVALPAAPMDQSVELTRTGEPTSRRWTLQSVAAVLGDSELTHLDGGPPVLTAEAAAVAEEAGPTVAVPLGALVAARSGDKGGNATLGVWARESGAQRWLAGWLSTDRLRELVPDAADLDVHRWELPNLGAVGFTLVGFLGRGVGACLRLDPQAKGLGEFLRARVVEIPSRLLAADEPEQQSMDINVTSEDR